MASGLHEEFSREHAVEAASNKRFGLVVGGDRSRCSAARAPWWHGEVGSFSGVLMAIGLVLIAAALIKPEVLEGANRGWMKLGLLLHKVTNPIFLGAMYAIAIVPTGLMMRAVRRRSDGNAAAARETATGSRAARAARPRESLEKPF